MMFCWPGRVQWLNFIYSWRPWIPMFWKSGTHFEQVVLIYIFWTFYIRVTYIQMCLGIILQLIYYCMAATPTWNIWLAASQWDSFSVWEGSAQMRNLSKIAFKIYRKSLKRELTVTNFLRKGIRRGIPISCINVWQIWVPPLGPTPISGTGVPLPRRRFC